MSIQETWRQHFYTSEAFKKATPYLAQAVVERAGPFPSNGLEEVVQMAVDAYFRRIGDVVAAYSQSPIETLFLQSLGAIALGKYGPHFVWFDETDVDDIDNHIANEVESLRNFEAFFGEFGSRGPGLEDIEALGLSEADTSTLKSYLVLYILSGRERGGYKLNLQAGFPESIKVEGRGVRPDMVFWSLRKPSLRIVAECDGFAYHKERDAFISDRKRDRVLKAHGYDVVRFSGPEIHKDPVGVAVELLSYLEKAEEKHG